MKDLGKLPDDLPVPEDDGACDHLPGTMPSVLLRGVSGTELDLGARRGTSVIYFDPMIGRPDSPPLAGWNQIPGARGCTPQSCSFRDYHAELRALGVQRVYGVSAQPLADQKEATQRLGLTFELLNDSELALAKALRLPTFEYRGATFIKCLTLIATDGVMSYN